MATLRLPLLCSLAGHPEQPRRRQPRTARSFQAGVGRRQGQATASARDRRDHGRLGSGDGRPFGTTRAALGAVGFFRGDSGLDRLGDANRRAATAERRTRLARVRRRRGGGGATACWSVEVSVATSAFVAGTVATLLRRGDRRSRGHALFLAVFGSMQVVDAVLWWNDLHGGGGIGGGLTACDLTNRVATRAGLAIICLEPMAAMLGTHVIAGRRPHPLLVAGYSAVFILTPLAGTSMLAQRAPCDVSSPPPASTPVFAPSSVAVPHSSGDVQAPSIRLGPIDGDADFASRQIGSGPWRQLGTNDARVIDGSAFGGGGSRVNGLEAKVVPPADPLTCNRVGPSWFDILSRLDDPCVCSAVTPQGHLQYGGLDVVYHRALAPWDKPEPCRLDGGGIIMGSREIPLALRALFLAAMAVPFGKAVLNQSSQQSIPSVIERFLSVLSSEFRLPFFHLMSGLYISDGSSSRHRAVPPMPLYSLRLGWSVPALTRQRACGASPTLARDSSCSPNPPSGPTRMKKKGWFPLGWRDGTASPGSLPCTLSTKRLGIEFGNKLLRTAETLWMVRRRSSLLPRDLFLLVMNLSMKATIVLSRLPLPPPRRIKDLLALMLA